MSTLYASVLEVRVTVEVEGTDDGGFDMIDPLVLWRPPANNESENVITHGYLIYAH